MMKICVQDKVEDGRLIKRSRAFQIEKDIAGKWHPQEMYKLYYLTHKMRPGWRQVVPLPVVYELTHQLTAWKDSCPSDNLSIDLKSSTSKCKLSVSGYWTYQQDGWSCAKTINKLQKESRRNIKSTPSWGVWLPTKYELQSIVKARYSHNVQ